MGCIVFELFCCVWKDDIGYAGFGGIFVFWGTFWSCGFARM
jgi:hypothetical protein